MPLSNYGKDLLLKITQSKPGQVDVSKIPDEVMDDVVDEVGGLLTFHKSLRLNKAIMNGLSTEEIAAANILLDQVKEGILDGKGTLARGPMGHVVMMPGIESAASRLSLPKAAQRPYQIKVKSLKKWGITYGKRIWMNHPLVQDLAAGGAVAATALAWLPVAGWIVTAISLAVAVLKTFDRGDGVYFYITFGGVWWLRAA